MDVATRLRSILAQSLELPRIILISVEADLLVVAALNQVQRNAGEGQTPTAWHDDERRLRYAYMLHDSAAVIPSYRGNRGLSPKLLRLTCIFLVTDYLGVILD